MSKLIDGGILHANGFFVHRGQNFAYGFRKDLRDRKIYISVEGAGKNVAGEVPLMSSNNRDIEAKVFELAELIADSEGLPPAIDDEPQSSKCANCKHWKRDNPESRGPEAIGQCRRYPPVRSTSGYMGLFPFVHEREICGEWTAIPEDSKTAVPDFVED